MPNVPWYTQSHWRNVRSSSNSGIERLTEEEQEFSTSFDREQQPVSNKRNGNKRRYNYLQEIEQFNPEELAAKRKAAIEDEAVKKAAKDVILQKKLEEKWIKLGQLICEVTPENFSLHSHPISERLNDCTGDEVLINVANFTANLKKLIGNETKGTILGNTMGFAVALCNAPQHSLKNVDQRVQRARQLKAEMEQKEKEEKAKMDACWTEIGKAVCSFTLEELGLSGNGSSDVINKLKREDLKSEASKSEDIVKQTSRVFDSPEKGGGSDLEESHDGDYTEADEVKGDDYKKLSARRRSTRMKKNLAERGEDVVANFFNFTTAVWNMMGPNSKQTCLRSPYEFTSVLCNVAEKSVRDRHTAIKIEDES